MGREKGSHFWLWGAGLSDSSSSQRLEEEREAWFKQMPYMVFQKTKENPQGQKTQQWMPGQRERRGHSRAWRIWRQVWGCVEPWLWLQLCECAYQRQHQAKWILLYVNCTLIKLIFTIIEGCISSHLGQEGWRIVTTSRPTLAAKKLCSSKIIKKEYKIKLWK